jgi:hypothetical protein
MKLVEIGRQNISKPSPRDVRVWLQLWSHTAVIGTRRCIAGQIYLNEIIPSFETVKFEDKARDKTSDEAED